jgi:hypothetical protein
MVAGSRRRRAKRGRRAGSRRRARRAAPITRPAPRSRGRLRRDRARVLRRARGSWRRARREDWSAVVDMDPSPAGGTRRAARGAPGPRPRSLAPSGHEVTSWSGQPSAPNVPRLELIRPTWTSVMTGKSRVVPLGHAPVGLGCCDAGTGWPDTSTQAGFKSPSTADDAGTFVFRGSFVYPQRHVALARRGRAPARGVRISARGGSRGGAQCPPPSHRRPPPRPWPPRRHRPLRRPPSPSRTWTRPSSMRSSRSRTRSATQRCNMTPMATRGSGVPRV